MPPDDTPKLYTVTCRLRLVAIATITTYALSAARSLDAWRLWTCVGIIALLLGSELADRFRVLTISWSTRWFLIFAIAFISQTAVIIVTGGIHSPFVIIYIPILMIATLSQGWRGLIPMAGAQLLMLWGLTFLEVSGSLPAGFYPTERLQPTSAWLTVMWCSLLSVLLVGIGVMGLQLTRSLRESDEAALKAERRVAEALQGRNRDLIALTGAVAHELKNPLTAVQSLATLLRKRTDAGSREEELLSVMVEELHRVRDTLQEFLDFSRPMDPLQTQPVALAALAERVLRTHRGMAQREGISLALEADPVAVVSGDPRKLEQVVVNLLQNAIEASPAGETVTVRCSRTPAGCMIAIRDHGAGLDPGIEEGLFRPGATTKATGSGLGLTISRNIAEQHGGALALHNAPGGGCIATLTLLQQPPEATVSHPP